MQFTNKILSMEMNCYYYDNIFMPNTGCVKITYTCGEISLFDRFFPTLKQVSDKQFRIINDSNEIIFTNNTMKLKIGDISSEYFNYEMQIDFSNDTLDYLLAMANLKKWCIDGCAEPFSFETDLNITIHITLLLER